MAGIIRFFGKLNNGLNRLTVITVAIAVIAVAGAVIWSLHALRNSGLSIGGEGTIDCTPTIVDRLKHIGQWEFLAISDEEIIDTMRTGFFSDDELVRIYYGTLRLGIDLRDCSEEWIRTEKDTIYVTIPEVRLLDYNFIDEAKTRSFFETGKWSNADRKAMYEKARNIMMKRCLTKENTDIAQANAQEQITRMLQPIAAPKTVKVIK